MIDRGDPADVRAVIQDGPNTLGQVTVRLAPTRGVLRALRGGLLAVTSGGLSVAAHTIGGGMAPDPAVTVVGTVLLAGAGCALADRRRGPLAILAVLGTAQLAVHVLLSTLGPHDVAGVAVAPAVDPVTMTAAHAVAALATGLLLARAESAVFGLAAALGLLLPRRWTPPPVDAAGTPLVVPAAPLRPVLDVLFRRVRTRRGPPLAA